VAVSGGLAVDGLLEVELPDNDTGAEVPVVADDLDELEVRLLAGAVGVDVDRQGSATPMAYESWTRARRARPAATSDLAIQRAV
jgi:hypothetical protein